MQCFVLPGQLQHHVGARFGLYFCATSCFIAGSLIAMTAVYIHFVNEKKRNAILWITLHVNDRHWIIYMHRHLNLWYVYGILPVDKEADRESMRLTATCVWQSTQKTNESDRKTWHNWPVQTEVYQSGKEKLSPWFEGEDNSDFFILLLSQQRICAWYCFNPVNACTCTSSTTVWKVNDQPTDSGVSTLQTPSVIFIIEGLSN